MCGCSGGYLVPGRKTTHSIRTPAPFGVGGFIVQKVNWHERRISARNPQQFESWETMNKFPQRRTPRIGMGCKAKSAAIPEGIASIFNAADRPSSRMCALRGTCSAFPLKRRGPEPGCPGLWPLERRFTARCGRLSKLLLSAQQLQHLLWQLVGLGDHGRASLLQHLGARQHGGLCGEVGILDAAA
jgi:hypothetical protein